MGLVGWGGPAPGGACVHPSVKALLVLVSVSRKERVKASRALHLDLCSAGVGTLPLHYSKEHLPFLSTWGDGHPLHTGGLRVLFPFCWLLLPIFPSLPRCISQASRGTSGEGGLSCFHSFMLQHSSAHPTLLRLRPSWRAALQAL